ncbi:MULTISPECIES: MerR family transcriptional regulator [unclassified Clostridium]|uniref:MerR family transcriptional regulator n=1 Tax=unclassified Clostridium TaxID=2614128 RepID=UPI0002976780|nr:MULTISPECIES: MerR family transcriptional regulator [unclassified Clostridium]EKQ51247.1 MAG: putative transcriptional regulator [Clostridium sp. Maddingley MBC34-26]
MEYTVQKLSKIAGISTRTLRYYDEIGILKPARINSSGYRIYGKKEVDKLQQILFYRELGVSLENINNILLSPSFDSTFALKEHRDKLLDKRNQIDMLIANVNKTIASIERGIIMNDKDKFEGFKQNIIDENEKKYGEEIRAKYGDNAIDESNKKFKNMSKEEYDKFEKLGTKVIDTLKEAFETNDPSSELAQKAADLHRQWLSYSWSNYSKEAHAGLAQMYVDDERFTAFYDKHQPGLAAFLRDAVFIYTGIYK